MAEDGLFINHCVAVRSRITGNGVLKTKLLGLDANYENTYSLPNLQLAPGPQRLYNLLANFTNQKYQVEFTTEDIDEYWQLDKIIVYNKAVATGFPQ